MEQERDFVEGPHFYQTTGDLVERNGNDESSNEGSIGGIRIDLDAKIHRYLKSTGAAWWPMRVFQITTEEELDEAEAWIKELIGKVLNA